MYAVRELTKGFVAKTIDLLKKKGELLRKGEENHFLVADFLDEVCLSLSAFGEEVEEEINRELG